MRPWRFSCCRVVWLVLVSYWKGSHEERENKYELLSWCHGMCLGSPVLIWAQAGWQPRCTLRSSFTAQQRVHSPATRRHTGGSRVYLLRPVRWGKSVFQSGGSKRRVQRECIQDSRTRWSWTRRMTNNSDTSWTWSVPGAISRALCESSHLILNKAMPSRCRKD